MWKAAASIAACIATAVACVPSGPPTVKCPVITFDHSVPAEASSAAAAAALTVVPCEDGGYGLTAPGARRLTPDELLPLKEKLAPEMIGLEGVTSIGVGGCCNVGGAPFDKEGCIRIDVDRETPAVARVPALVAKVRTAETDIRVSIHQGAPRAPRCQKTDPACGPTPYEGHMCVDADATRDWSRERVTARRTEGQPAPCEHDGECVSCNTICTSYKYRPSACTLELSTRLTKAYCGCIDRGCAWFEMRP